MLQQESSSEHQSPIVMGDSFSQAEDGSTIISGSETAPYAATDSQPLEVSEESHQESQEPVASGDEFKESKDDAVIVSETTVTTYGSADALLDEGSSSSVTGSSPVTSGEIEEPVVIGDEFIENEDGTTVIIGTESFQHQDIESTATIGQHPPDQLTNSQLATTGADPLLIAGVGLAVAGTGVALRHRFHNGRKNIKQK